jgi:hypothetical protein
MTSDTTLSRSDACIEDKTVATMNGIKVSLIFTIHKNIWDERDRFYPVTPEWNLRERRGRENVIGSNHDASSTMAPAAASHTAPMEDKDADLVDVKDKDQAANEEEAGFDEVQNITLDFLYQQQHQVCEAKNWSSLKAIGVL